MIHLDLTTDERALLEETLDSCLSDLRMEILDTDRREYKDLLKEREALMKKIKAALHQAQEDASALA